MTTKKKVSTTGKNKYIIRCYYGTSARAAKKKASAAKKKASGAKKKTSGVKRKVLVRKKC